MRKKSKKVITKEKKLPKTTHQQIKRIKMFRNLKKQLIILKKKIHFPLKEKTPKNDEKEINSSPTKKDENQVTPPSLNKDNKENEQTKKTSTNPEDQS